MLIKTILSIVLSLSVMSCFADSGENETKPSIDLQKKIQSSNQSNSSSQPSQSSPSKSSGTNQSTQDSNTNEKPSMVDYCRKHPC